MSPNILQAGPIVLQYVATLSAFFRILFSCSLSRVRTQFFVSTAAEGAGLEVRTAGDRTRRRRLNKLSCAGWIPHDRGSVSGLPHSRGERRSQDRLITGREDSPPWSCRPAVRTSGTSSVIDL